ncbi:MAG: cobalamin-binding protein [Chlorobiaceae bacterium]|nr:cobalamin-binding protein [Chlorobiaceae bacterium]
MKNFLRFIAHELKLVVLIGLLLLAAGCSSKREGRAEQSKGKLRIVSLAPSVTEMLFAIGAGDQLVGRSSGCKRPEGAKNLPVTGAFGRPSLEVIAALHPDIVIDDELSNKKSGEKITAMGFPRATITCNTPDDIPSALRKLGKLTGHEKQAESLAISISTGLEQFRKSEALKQNKSSVYLEIWNSPLWTGGKGSYISGMITYAGGRNIGDDVRKDYFAISPEWVIRQNPDVIACMYMAKTTPASEKVMSRFGWDHVAAVKHGKVYDGFDNSFFLIPGPRVLEGIEQLRQKIRNEK